MKRSNGEGTIYKRNDGRWCAAYYDDSPSPKRHFVCGKTQAEVKQKMKEKRKEPYLQNSKQADLETLEEWVLYFLENYKKYEIKETTYATYRGVYNKHIKNSIPGKTKLNKLKSNHLQKLYNSKSEEGYNAKTVKHISVLINSALDKAVQLKMIKENVNMVTVLPKQEEFQAQPLSAEQVKKIILDTKEEPLYPIVIFALSTGMRKGEVMALKWDNIDFDRRELEVTGNLCRIPKTIEEDKIQYQYAVLSPKSKKGRRIIPLTDLALAALQIQKERQNAEKIYYQEIYMDQNLVFANETGDFLNQRTFMRDYHTFLKKYGMPDIRFHDLRHPYVKHTTKKYNSEKQKTQATKIDLIAWVFRFCTFNYSKRSWTL